MACSRREKRMPVQKRKNKSVGDGVRAESRRQLLSLALHLAGKRFGPDLKSSLAVHKCGMKYFLDNVAFPYVVSALLKGDFPDDMLKYLVDPVDPNTGTHIIDKVQEDARIVKVDSTTGEVQGSAELDMAMDTVETAMIDSALESDLKDVTVNDTKQDIDMVESEEDSITKIDEDLSEQLGPLPELEEKGQGLPPASAPPLKAEEYIEDDEEIDNVLNNLDVSGIPETPEEAVTSTYSVEELKGFV